MEKEKVYFENSEVIIEKNNKRKVYPISKIRYKRTSFVYKNASFAPADGRRKEEFLELYYKKKIIAIINSSEYELGDLIRNYNLKVFSEYGEENFIYLKKPIGEKFMFALYILAIIVLFPVYIVMWLDNYQSIKYNFISISILVGVIMSIVFCTKNSCKIFFNEEQIMLKYGRKKKFYNYEQISEYNVIQNFFNNSLEVLVIWFEDGEEIRLSEEYDNYIDFFRILNDKAYSTYM